MKRQNFFALMAAVFLTTSVIADECDPCCLPCCEPCDYLCDLCDPCEGWTVEADCLYWQPRRCELIYASTGYSDELKVKGIDLSYDDGFRIGAFKECGDMLLGVRYTSYSFDDKQTVKDPNVRASRIFEHNIDNLLVAHSHYNVDLGIVDIEAAYLLRDECDSFAKAFGGVRIASIDQKLSSAYGEDADDMSGSHDSNRVERVTEDNDMKGYGLYIGGAGSYTFCDCYSFYGTMSVGTMVAEFNRHYVQSTVSVEEYTINNRYKDDCYKIVSNFDFGVGVGYDLSAFCCVDLHATLGYEFHHWFNTLDFMLAEVDANEFEIDRHSEDLGFDGLFLRLAATF